MGDFPKALYGKSASLNVAAFQTGQGKGSGQFTARPVRATGLRQAGFDRKEEPEATPATGRLSGQIPQAIKPPKMTSRAGRPGAMGRARRLNRAGRPGQSPGVNAAWPNDRARASRAGRAGRAGVVGQAGPGQTVQARGNPRAGIDSGGALIDLPGGKPGAGRAGRAAQRGHGRAGRAGAMAGPGPVRGGLATIPGRAGPCPHVGKVAGFEPITFRAIGLRV
jgi:hypothetical protein